MRWILSLWCVFWLSAGAWAQGSARFLVRDTKTGKVLAGALVTFPKTEQRGSTNREGILEYHALPTGKQTYEVRCLFEGIAYKVKTGTMTIRKNQVTDIMVELEFLEPLGCNLGKPIPKDWGILEFVVTDATTGKPLEDAMVLLEPMETEKETRSEPTSEQGKRALATKPGTYCYAVVAFVDGVFYERQRGEVTVSPGKEATVTLRLQPRN